MQFKRLPSISDPFIPQVIEYHDKCRELHDQAVINAIYALINMRSLALEYIELPIAK